MSSDQEPRDVEERLRASLNAYAEVVDDRPLRRAPVGGRRLPPSSRVRGWRAPALVAAAVLAVAGGAWLVTDAGAPSPTAASGSSTAEDGAEAAMAGEPSAEVGTGARPSEDRAAAAAGPGGQLVVPTPAEVGVSYPFDLYTHCGIFGADVAGAWFAADPQLVAEFGPPAGWENPYQRGTLTLESAEEAVFRDDAGHVLALRAAPESERPPPCA